MVSESRVSLLTATVAAGRQGRVFALLALLVLPASADAGEARPISDGLSARPTLAEILDRTGKSVELFWQQFPAVTCTELVTQSKIGNGGKVLFQRDSAFDYLIFLDLEGNELSVEESRVATRKSEKGKDLPLLITSGFSTLILVFHPFYQGSHEYHLLGEENSEGRRMLKLGFQHIQGTRSTSALRMRGRDFPLDLTGEAWIDGETGEIARIAAHLSSPMDDLNLKALDTEVRYGPVRFEAVHEASWLPSQASIQVATEKQTWRNLHKFVEYRHFTVNSESAVKK